MTVNNREVALPETTITVHEPHMNGVSGILRKEAYMVTTKEITITTNNHKTTNSTLAEEEEAETKSLRKISTLAGAVKTILHTVGENPAREGLLQTPERFAKALLFFTKGYDEDPRQILRSALFHEQHRELVLVKNIEFSSLCEHHLVPFMGKVGKPKPSTLCNSCSPC